MMRDASTRTRREARALLLPSPRYNHLSTVDIVNHPHHQWTGFAHDGNLNLREIIRGYTKEYSSTKSREGKSVLLTAIADSVRTKSPHGGFVKQDTQTGGWYEVGRFLAREKISQVFRDILHDAYRSSTDSRRKIRQTHRAGQRQSSSSLTSNNRGARPGTPGEENEDCTLSDPLQHHHDDCVDSNRRAPGDDYHDQPCRSTENPVPPPAVTSCRKADDFVGKILRTVGAILNHD
jgi:hypothetical protein